MNITNFPGAANSSSTDLTQRFQEFNALKSALQSGNIASAQGAFAGFLQEVQKTALTAGGNSLFAPGSQPSTDLNNLGKALNAADISGAQKAFAALQEDLQHAGQPTSATSVGHAQIHRPLTHAEIARNGTRSFGANAGGRAAVQAVGQVLNSQA